MKNERWQFRINAAITGMVLIGARRGQRGPWLGPRDVPSVCFYLCADERGRIQQDVTLDVIKSDKAIKAQRIRPGGLLFQGILSLEPSVAEQEAARASRRLANWKARGIKGIYNLRDLHKHVGSMSDDSTDEACKAGIARRLYKDTACGIGFSCTERGVTVAGYCEGTDAECAPHVLLFPFKPEEFDAAVQEADADGCALWDDTHGCDECGLDGAINADCEECGGEGRIL